VRISRKESETPLRPALPMRLRRIICNLLICKRRWGILMENRQALDQLIQDATAHYEVGQGLQAEVLQAQVERTRLVREITMYHDQMGRIESHLKGLLHRRSKLAGYYGEKFRCSQLCRFLCFLDTPIVTLPFGFDPLSERLGRRHCALPNA